MFTVHFPRLLPCSGLSLKKKFSAYVFKNSSSKTFTFIFIHEYKRNKSIAHSLRKKVDKNQSIVYA